MTQRRRRTAAYVTDPVAFVDDLVLVNEKGKPWRLSPHQRRVLARAVRRDPSGALAHRLVLWSEPKKSGKTFLAAVLALWWAITNSNTEIVVVANDLEQAVGRVFRTAAALCKLNPALAASVTPLATEIRVSNGTVIAAIASEYRGAAGSRHSLVVFDELWGYDSERAQRLYEELTPPPTEASAWVLVVTYAGFAGESALLEAMYRRGLAGTRVDAELEMYEADGLFMFWSHTPRQPWQTERYYAEQARSLRPATFARLHRNEWVSAESAFLTPELWDAAVDPEHRPLGPDPGLVVAVGVDAAVKHDNAAVAAVARDGARLVLVWHRLYAPTPAAPLDLEATVEADLRALAARYAVAAIYADPYQMHRSITALARAGLPIREFPQTVANTTRMGQALYDLLRSRSLVVYPDAALRQQALNAAAVETPRGFRVAKERASRKIDGVVALAIACVAALDAPAPLDAAMTPDEAARLRAFAAWWSGPGGPAPMLDAFAPHPLDDLVGDGLSDADDDYENFNPWPIPRQRVSPLT